MNRFSMPRRGWRVGGKWTSWLFRLLLLLLSALPAPRSSTAASVHLSADSDHSLEIEMPDQERPGVWEAGRGVGVLAELGDQDREH